MVTNNSSNNYATTSFIVFPTPGKGNYTTISGAVTAAGLIATPSSVQTVYVGDGVYTENVTLKPYVNIVSLNSMGSNGSSQDNALVLGKFSDGGVYCPCNITGLGITTNGDYAVELTNAGSPAVISLYACQITGAGNTLFHISGTSTLALKSCTSNLLSGAPALYNMTGAGNLYFYECLISNSAGSTTAPTCSASLVYLQGSYCECPIAVSSTGEFELISSSVVSPTTSLTTAGTGSSAIYNSLLSASGASSCISVGAGTNVTATNNTVFSTAANAFTGTGTIIASGNTFAGTGYGNNVTTQTPSWFNAGLLQTTPPTSSTATTGFGSLIVGTPRQNTLGYDILVNVSVVATAAVGATIVLGVGPTNTPTTNALTAAFSVAISQSFTAIVPNGYYCLVNTTGTITVGSITTQVCPL